MDYQSFAALIYVTDTENEAVMRMFSWEEVTFEGDDQVYYRAKESKSGLPIVAAKQDEMGMTASATLTMKLIEHFRPKYVMMPGIAAGTLEESGDEQMYGDVVLASMVWNYSNGKYVSKDIAQIVFGEVGFLPRPTSITVDPDLIPYFERAISSPRNETHVHIGAMASGSAVVANKAILEKQIRGRFVDTKGLEMEGYGVAYAAAHATEPRPKAIIAKSVCDFADSRKSDKYQKFAAFTSCEFVKLMIEEILD
ncbi:MAG: hypothetical protein KBT31_04525 [Firmicutes bacterium]|nr:hypothetical protein [Candidatus Colimorpha enterica]